MEEDANNGEMQVARDHGRLMCSVWRDLTFVALSSGAQRMYALLLSQSRLTLCGTLDYTPARWANLASDTTEDDVRAALAELETESFVIIDEAAEELLIRSFVRHDGVCDSPNLIQGMWKAWAGVYSPVLRAAVVLELPDKAFQVGFGTDKKDYQPPAEALDLSRNKPSENPSPNPSENPSGDPSPTPVPVPSPVPSPANVRSLPLPDRFDEFWDVYPKKVDKAAAKKAWTRVTKTVDPQAIIDGAATYRDDPSRSSQFTKNPATFLNAGSWENEPVAQVSGDVYTSPMDVTYR